MSSKFQFNLRTLLTATTACALWAAVCRTFGTVEMRDLVFAGILAVGSGCLFLYAAKLAEELPTASWPVLLGAVAIIVFALSTFAPIGAIFL